MSEISMSSEPLDIRFTAPITKDATSGWLCAVMPGSGDGFGTRKPIKISGTVDGHPFDATMLPLGDGSHMIPLRAALRKLVQKVPGEEVVIRIWRKR